MREKSVVHPEWMPLSLRQVFDGNSKIELHTNKYYCSQTTTRRVNNRVISQNLGAAFVGMCDHTCTHKGISCCTVCIAPNVHHRQLVLLHFAQSGMHILVLLTPALPSAPRILVTYPQQQRFCFLGVRVVATVRLNLSIPPKGPIV